MRRRGESAEPDDESDDELDSVSEEDDEGEDEEEEDEEEERPPRRHPPPRRRHRGRPAPMHPWTIADLDEEEDRADDEGSKDRSESEGFFQSLRRPVFFRARDSWYFEPLVALAIIVLLLVSLFAYTSNWPPVYVVESSSMQHGSGDAVGLINAGDLVLVKQVAPSQVLTYIDGEATGYSTYGEFGDVLLYYPNGDTHVTPVIHRAILYLDWNPSNHTYSAPALAPLPCGNASGALYSISGSRTGCGSTGLLTSITLYHVGWRNATVAIPLGGLGHYSGFITMGDNNLIAGSPPQGEPDQFFGAPISALVSGSWVVGEARGMLPWVGGFKLLLDGNAGFVPPQSWQLLGLTLSSIVLAGFGLHYLFRVEGIEDPRRLAEERGSGREREEDEEDRDPEDWAGRPRGSRWRQLREWLAAPDDEEDEPPVVHRRHARAVPRRTSLKPSRLLRGHGRPRPAVRKSVGGLHRRPVHRSRAEEESL